MAYCRWSSDNYRCDIYCYDDVLGGITTHVARYRVVGEVPPAPVSLLLDGKVEEFQRALKKREEFFETCERVPIGLPYDGHDFNDADLESFLERLLHLKGLGYNVPDWVINNVRELRNDGEHNLETKGD